MSFRWINIVWSIELITYKTVNKMNTQAELKNDYHQNCTVTYYQIADANWGMYHVDVFNTEAEARAVIEKEYTNSSNEYWRNRPQVVIKVTTIKEVL